MNFNLQARLLVNPFDVPSAVFATPEFTNNTLKMFQILTISFENK